MEADCRTSFGDRVCAFWKQKLKQSNTKQHKAIQRHCCFLKTTDTIQFVAYLQLDKHRTPLLLHSRIQTFHHNIV
jgi:hypothetical protein